MIVDDHPAVREGLELRIRREADLEVCGQAADLSEALRIVTAAQPDAAVVDLSLKGGDGIDLIKRLLKRNDRLRILVWSMHNESMYAERALRAGALGYITKEESTDQIVSAIRSVVQGKIWLSGSVTERILHRAVGIVPAAHDASPVEGLADRELQVFRLIGMGKKTAEIADLLHLSIKTIETYRDRIRRKLDLDDGTRLAHYATCWVLEHT
jgi:DNA-binding NarL/FixJ family response regulator